MLEVAKIHKGHQARKSINEDTVVEYAKHIEEGGEFPPIIVFFDSVDYHLADGYHRLLATERVGCLTILEEVRVGTSRDALKYALGANSHHGLPRTNADKRNAVEIALNDSEWSRLSTRDIAKLCNVSHNLVAEIQRERNPNTQVKDSSVIGLQPNIPAINRNENVRDTSMAKPNESAIQSDVTEIHFGNIEPSREEELEAQNKELADLLHDYQKAHTPDLDEKLSEIQKLRIELEAVTKSRDSLQNENAELRKQCDIQRKEIMKLKKLYIK